MSVAVFSSDECVICLERPPGPYFVPCGHHCCCKSCCDEIMTVIMPCPLCRHVIDAVAVVAEPAPILEEQLRSFREERRVDYLADLRGPVKHTRNAAFVGKNQFARQVSSAITSELETRQRETAGGERCMTPRSKIEMRISDGLLHIDYKVGRKVRKEAFAYCEWPALQDEMLRLFPTIPEALALATYGPAYYWLVHYHHQGRVEEALERLRTLK